MDQQTWINIILPLAGALIPAILARLGIHIPNLTPDRPTPPQVPTVDQPWIDAEKLVDGYDNKTVRAPDPADIEAMRRLSAKMQPYIVGK